MKLLVPSAAIVLLNSEAAVFANKSVVATNVNLAYSSKSHLRSSNPVLTDPSLVTGECNFPLNAEADTGVLGCAVGFLCMEDHSSSTGGRCVSKIENDERGLQSCTKCTGYNACEGLTEAFKVANIGCGSCNGEFACMGVSKLLKSVSYPLHWKFNDQSKRLLLCPLSQQYNRSRCMQW